MRRKFRSSAPERPSIGTIASTATLLVLAVTWITFVVWVGIESGDHWLVILAMLLWGSSMIAAGFVFVHGLYLMYRLLPAIDEHLDPHLAAYTRQRGDPMFWRIHRVLLYSGSLAWRWAHRRMEYRDYDFHSLPPQLRLPLLVEFYALLASGVALVTGAALMKLSQELGLM